MSELKSGPEGVFAQPANEGRSSATRFAVVPQLQVKLGYDVTSWLRLTVGYDLLYNSEVIRPGDQISHYVPEGADVRAGRRGAEHRAAQ